MEDDEDIQTHTNTTTLTTDQSSIMFFTIFLIILSSNLERAKSDDTTIMHNFAKSLKPAPSGWSGRDPCRWQGVKCDSSNQVTSISLNSKAISGTLPPDLPKLSNLATLSLQNNYLTGAIPAIANMSSLQEIYLDSNAFTEFSDPFLVGLPNLQVFSIENNPLSSWTIPLSIGESSDLQVFRAGNTSITGSIPDIFSSFPSLTTVRLSYNNLTGFLPRSFAGSSIEYLWINNQKEGLSGTLDVLGAMTNLVQAWVHVNDFVGPIPDMSKCSSLFDLQLRDNQLTGIVPSSIFGLPKLANVSLQNNRFQGPFPVFPKGVQVSLGNANSFCNPKPGPCDPQVNALISVARGFGYPLELAESWKGNDPCKNWGHVTCDSNGKVIVVNFAKKGWSGMISPAFANLSSLNSIILNDNDLVGSIPNELTSLKGLKLLDLSNNNLTGKVPDFGSGVSVKVGGNEFINTNVNTSSSLKSPPGAINSPSSNSGNNGSDESKNTSEESNGSGSHLSAYKIVGITVGSLLGVIIIGLLLLLFIKKKRKEKNIYDHSPQKGGAHNLKMSPLLEQHNSGATPIYPARFSTNPSYDSGNSIPIDVLREVTNNFNEKNIIGKGGFGVVYKGVLHDGTQIAVKRMEFSSMHSTKGKNEFDAEIAVLSKVRHRHLVALLGYCIHENERFIVYEYMPQGTLTQHLFEGQNYGLPPLTWKERLVIALDVARGIEYLHSLAQQSFIHRDLKPSNILLGDDKRAKVSDFGLVKNAPDQGKYSVETRLAGTFGYLAPEYAATGRVTTKVDIFSYGVVLMELITGRIALDESLPEDQQQLVTWFRRILITKDDLRKFTDPNLETNDEEIFDSISKVAELSGYCTVREPNQRPDMSHVVNILSPLVEQWRPTDQSDMNEDGGFNGGLISLPEALKRWQAGETITTSTTMSSGCPPATPGFGDSFTDVEGQR